jgi:hypothetical protein
MRIDEPFASNLSKRKIDVLGQLSAKNFNLTYYIYSIANNAASGRFKLNSLARLEPALRLKPAFRADCL